MPIRGDISRMGKLAEHIGRLAAVPSQVAGKVATKIDSLVRAEFATGNDPYGRPWKQLAASTVRKGRTPPPLTATSHMVDTLKVQPMQSAGVSVTFDAPYARFHQTGTKRMPARRPLPTNQLPATWSKALADTTTAAVKGAL